MAMRFDRGLVMHLYPEELLRFGATHSLPAEDAVSAEHYFLCLSADAREGTWTPLHVTRGQDRLPIIEAAKTGHPRFTRGISWYGAAELWRIPHKAVQRAAQVAGDSSTAKAQNRVAADAVPVLPASDTSPSSAPAAS